MSDEHPLPEGIETFEAAMEELDMIVTRLEGGGLSLDETISLYERGQLLAAACGKLLDQAQLRLEQLRESGQGFDAVPLDDEE